MSGGLDVSGSCWVSSGLSTEFCLELPGRGDPGPMDPGSVSIYCEDGLEGTSVFISAAELVNELARPGWGCDSERCGSEGFGCCMGCISMPECTEPSEVRFQIERFSLWNSPISSILAFWFRI